MLGAPRRGGFTSWQPAASKFLEIVIFAQELPGCSGLDPQLSSEWRVA